MLRTHPALLGIPPPPPAAVQRRGACKGYNATFFSPLEGDKDRARSICAGCAVAAACRRYAVEHGPRIVGIWGGTDEAEREGLRRLGARGPSLPASLAAGAGPVPECGEAPGLP